jgi:hypothetical protein
MTTFTILFMIHSGVIIGLLLISMLAMVGEDLEVISVHGIDGIVGTTSVGTTAGIAILGVGTTGAIMAGVGITGIVLLGDGTLGAIMAGVGITGIMVQTLLSLITMVGDLITMVVELPTTQMVFTTEAASLDQPIRVQLVELMGLG